MPQNLPVIQTEAIPMTSLCAASSRIKKNQVARQARPVSSEVRAKLDALNGVRGTDWKEIPISETVRTEFAQHWGL